MRKLLWLVPVALFVINCGGGGGNLMPLTVGNTWNYRTISTIDFVDTSYTDVVDTTTSVSEITAETTLDDSTEVFEQVSTTTIDTVDYVDTSFVLDNGDFVLVYADKADAVPDTMIAYPVEESKTWTVNATTTAVVIGKEDVTVTAGTFDCWKIGYIVDSDTSFTFVADGTGTVKSTFGSADNMMTTTSSTELQSSDIQ
jgi:hypothetical protein